MRIHLGKTSARTRVLFILLGFVGLFAVAFITFPPASRAKQQPGRRTKSTRPRFVPGDVLVRYRSEPVARAKTGRTVVRSRSGEDLATQVEQFHGSQLIDGLRLARVPADKTLAAVEAFRNQPDVLYAEPNYILKADALPNDEHFVANRQYGLNSIGAPQAWNLTTGSSSIVVAVLDQGIDINHEDLQANIWTNPAPGSVAGITGDLHGFDFNGNTGNIFSGTDPENHASHVAGIIGAVGNNSKGIAGVNWHVGLMSLKFLDADGFGETADAISACAYAKAMRDLWESSGHTKGANIRVVNASFGGAAFSQSFITAISSLNDSGILFVAAAGNVDNGTREPNNNLVPHFPSSFDVPNIISVASTNQADNLSSFSHYGRTAVDLGAPGEGILSTTPPCTDPGPFPDHPCDPSFPLGFTPAQDTYSFFDGTSMATPHVSGSAALLWARNSNLTVKQVKDLLLLNGDVDAQLVDKTLTGRRLNVGNSMQIGEAVDAVPPDMVSNFQITAQNGRNVTLGWTAAGDNGTGTALYELRLKEQTGPGQFLVTPLKGVVPAAAGTAQSTQVNLPYRHTSGTIELHEFDKRGNEGPTASVAVNVPLLAGDPYILPAAPGNVVALTTGGARVDLDGDDKYADFALPTGFSFPFFGNNFTELILSTNGALYFSDPPRRTGLAPGDTNDADDPPGSPRALGGYQMIAPLWEDLDLRDATRANAGIYWGALGPNGTLVTPTGNSTEIVFRWQGKPCNFNGTICDNSLSDPVNFEVELRRDGIIKIRYGSGNTHLFPTVGIGGGDQDGYVVGFDTSEDTEISLNNAAEVTIKPRAAVQMAAPAMTVNEGAGTVNVLVTRLDSSAAATVNYSTSDNFAGDCAAVTHVALAKCDYGTSGGTLHFAAGEMTKTIVISIVDDGYVEGDETFSVGLSDPSGMSLGPQTATTITIKDNDVTPSNPFDNNAFFVRQQYLDFLLREPDPGGFNDWLNVLNNCQPNQGGLGSDPACDRVHVSSGFFRSTEFGERGYWSYRYYHAALGRRPQFAEFVPDMRRLSGFQTAAEDEANRVAFVNDFMQRPEFTAIYAGLTDAAHAAQFIAKLEQTAHVTLPDTVPPTQPGQPPQYGRTELIQKMATGQFTAAQTLRAFIEQKTVFDAFFFRAFVAMQYFGYLLRDPEQAGYDDWVDVLTNGRGAIQPGDFHHLIFGFIYSVEYRQRFGP